MTSNFKNETFRDNYYLRKSRKKQEIYGKVVFILYLPTFTIIIASLFNTLHCESTVGTVDVSNNSYESPALF